MALTLLAGCASHYTKPESTFEIIEKEKSYEISLSESKLLLIIPKENLKKKSTTTIGTYRNFKFEDKIVDLVITGLFESSQDFSGIKKYWENNLIRWRDANYPEPLKVSFFKVGDWDVVAYELKRDVCLQSNLIAHLVKAGTWIELHLSYYCFASSGDRERLISLLKTIKVLEKK